MARCKSIKRNDERCSLNALSGSLYCHQHQDRQPPSESPPTAPEVPSPPQGRSRSSLFVAWYDGLHGDEDAARTEAEPEPSRWDRVLSVLGLVFSWPVAAAVITAIIGLWGQTIITDMQNAQKDKEIEVSRIKSMVQVAQGGLGDKSFSELKGDEFAVFAYSMAAFGSKSVPMLMTLLVNLDPSLFKDDLAHIDDLKKIRAIEDSLRNMAKYGGEAELVFRRANEILKNEGGGYCPEVHLAALRLLREPIIKKGFEDGTRVDPRKAYQPQDIFCCNSYKIHYLTRQHPNVFAKLLELEHAEALQCTNVTCPSQTTPPIANSSN
ncbi:MAG: hypothetical protein GY792_30665 [Gammaproteobacteria bacterium]|nr:hypothetical protein [Gammaproteobacteria bacterium]